MDDKKKPYPFKDMLSSPDKFFNEGIPFLQSLGITEEKLQKALEQSDRFVPSYEEAVAKAERSMAEIKEKPHRMDEVKFSQRQMAAIVTLAMVKLGFTEEQASNVCAEMELFVESYEPDELMRRGLILKQQWGKWDPRLDHKFK